MSQPDILRVAVAAAGGTTAVAEAFGMSQSGVSTRIAQGKWPSAEVRKLCELGGNIISVDKLLEYLEQVAAGERA